MISCDVTLKQGGHFEKGCENCLSHTLNCLISVVRRQMVFSVFALRDSNRCRVHCFFVRTLAQDRHFITNFAPRYSYSSATLIREVRVEDFSCTFLWQ